MAITLTAGCSSQSDGTPEEVPSTEQTATEEATDDHEGLLDSMAEEQASARAEYEAQITVMGALVLTPETSLILDDGTCLPLIPQQNLHDRIYPLTDEPQVQVLDASGAIVGTAQIERRLNSNEDACMFYFETRVPPGGGYYTAIVESITTDAVAESEAANGLITFNLAEGI
ncbi:hypothetical protein FE251_11955 [Georgenia wutianyii]|uniref:Lipoprotein n=1 Tax=Georgenia wutianyii TaxID=2585135 RepID=A0ABX5VP68_9MICO|nr:hypothetical protein [Georgenia wutianyii]QDB80013.1 hypothetical protein FE251_11955 [Georgenia wutianyii]